MAPLVTRRVVEIGAGYGRLCRAFAPETYLGLDVNSAAVQRAQQENPGYEFRTVRFVDEYEPADLYLAYTVFLHIDDEVIPDVVERLCRVTQRLVVAEILGARVPQRGNVPGFTRERVDYERLLAEQRFVLEEEIRRPYHYYPDAKLSCLVFKRREPAPTVLRVFPDDLADPYLEFSGLYEDGWTASDFNVALTQPPGATTLTVRGLLPFIDALTVPSQLRLVVDGQLVDMRTILPGEFEVRAPLATSTGTRQVSLHFSHPQTLPAPDGRSVGILLRMIGFELLAEASACSTRRQA